MLSRIAEGLGTCHSKLALLILLFLLIQGLHFPHAVAEAGSADLGPERITSFVSDISINQDGSITVTETITAVARGERIRRGIYRDIPTVLSGPLGMRHSTPLRILGVTRNDQPTPYFTERLGDTAGTLRINFGDDTFLQPGVHVFQLIYRSTGQVRFFQAYDELYWNVTGNDWEFVIEHAAGVVRLPEGTRVVQQAGYTGARGAQGTDFRTDLDDPGRVRFSTTQALRPGHGLTIAVAWPKGHVPEPTAAQKAFSLLQSNVSGLVGLIGLLVLLAYYLFTWNAVGRDPVKGAIFPRFHPPMGLSPAATRVVMNMGFDDKAFAAAVVNMAVKGFLAISEGKSGLARKFTLIRTGKSKEDADLSRGEAILASTLFSGISHEVEISQANQSRFKKAREGLRNLLYLEHEKVHFLKNKQYILIGGGLTLLTLAAMGLWAHSRETALFMSVWLSFWSIGVFFLLSGIVANFRAGGRATLVFQALFALPFVMGLGFGLVVYALATSPAATAAMLGMLGMNGLFYVLMKAPTFEGRHLMDEIEGFRMFLDVAEKDRLNQLHAPEVTSEVFERFLPYAMALDVETRWANRFEEAMARAGRKPVSYSPAWYRGPSFSPHALGSFTGSFAGSFASAMSSSTSSGSGGGGSSGGGGGGGGGGGR